MSKEEETPLNMSHGKTLTKALIAILATMRAQGTVCLEVDPPGGKNTKVAYTVTGEDEDLVYVDKDNPNGFEWFQMHLIASPTAKMHVCVDKAGMLETKVVSDDYNRSVTYTFTVVEKL